MGDKACWTTPKSDRYSVADVVGADNQSTVCDSEMSVYCVNSVAVMRARGIDTLMNIGSSGSAHECVRKSFIFKLVSDTKFMPVTREMDRAMMSTDEWHGPHTIHRYHFDAIRYLLYSISLIILLALGG